jgi:hypothetical protein
MEGVLGKSFVFPSRLKKQNKFYPLHGCETWSVTLREEHGLRASENRVQRRIFGAKRVEVAGGWRRLHNEELHNLYPSPSDGWGMENTLEA